MIRGYTQSIRDCSSEVGGSHISLHNHTYALHRKHTSTEDDWLEEASAEHGKGTRYRLAELFYFLFYFISVSVTRTSMAMQLLPFKESNAMPIT